MKDINEIVNYLFTLDRVQLLEFLDNFSIEELAQINDALTRAIKEINE